MWADASQHTYRQGDLFIGQDQGREIGITTERHAITIAGAGSGKGVSVIMPNLFKWPHNTLVIDPKGEAAENTAEARQAMGQKAYVIDPFNSARVDDSLKASYNPLDDLDPNSLTIKEDIETISDGIIMRGDASASHWDDGAQNLISGLIAFVLQEAPEGQKTLLEVREILRDDGNLERAVDQMKSISGCTGLCQSAAATVYAKEGQYFVSNARKNTAWLDSGGMQNVLGESSFSLSELKRGKASVFLVLPANYLGQHGRFLRLFVRCAIEEMSRKLPSGELRGSQCLFILDEFFSLGFIDEIAKAAGLMRGYGLQLWPILQDIGQLVTLYGREGSETFFGNADLHQFFGNTDIMTLEAISSRLGVFDLDDIPENPRDLETVHWTKEDRERAFQRELSKHGRARLPADKLADLIKRRDDVVADNMVCLVHGSTPLLIRPAPFFRNIDTEEANSKRYHSNNKSRFWFMFSGANLALMTWIFGAPLIVFPIAIGAGYFLPDVLVKILND